MECPACASSNVININLTMENGDPVKFYSCHECDKRWWSKDGVSIELDNVLELAKREPRRASRART